jgi:hypothetical protein
VKVKEEYKKLIHTFTGERKDHLDVFLTMAKPYGHFGRYIPNPAFELGTRGTRNMLTNKFY